MMSDLPVYKLERVFAAPRELVWKAWTDPEILHQWYGPGVETTIHKFDLKPEGVWLNEMNWGGDSHYQKVVFKEVNAPEKMKWLHYSSTDDEWNIKANPMMPDWPRILLTEVMFEEKDGETCVVLTQTPFEATETEIAFFAQVMSNMDKGWGGGYAVLDQILAELQA